MPGVKNDDVKRCGWLGSEALVTGWLDVLAALSAGKEPSMVEEEARCASEPIWKQ